MLDGAKSEISAYHTLFSRGNGLDRYVYKKDREINFLKAKS
jgi:hypothetical protein